MSTLQLASLAVGGHLAALCSDVKQRSACRVATRGSSVTTFLPHHVSLRSNMYAPGLRPDWLRQLLRSAGLPANSVASLQRSGFARGGVASPQPLWRGTLPSSGLPLATWLGFANAFGTPSEAGSGKPSKPGLRPGWGSGGKPPHNPLVLLDGWSDIRARSSPSLSIIHLDVTSFLLHSCRVSATSPPYSSFFRIWVLVAKPRHSFRRNDVMHTRWWWMICTRLVQILWRACLLAILLRK